jgi:hypothetical protein
MNLLPAPPFDRAGDGADGARAGAGEGVRRRRLLRPLDWWRADATKYPKLSSVARRFFGLPATTGACERLVSTAGMIIRKHRNRLSPRLAEALLILRQ